MSASDAQNLIRDVRMARMGMLYYTILYYTILSASITGNYTVYKTKQNKENTKKNKKNVCRDIPQGGHGIM